MMSYNKGHLLSVEQATTSQAVLSTSPADVRSPAPPIAICPAGASLQNHVTFTTKFPRVFWGSLESPGDIVILLLASRRNEGR